MERRGGTFASLTRGEDLGEIVWLRFLEAEWELGGNKIFPAFCYKVNCSLRHIYREMLIFLVNFKLLKNCLNRWCGSTILIHYLLQIFFGTSTSWLIFYKMCNMLKFRIFISILIGWLFSGIYIVRDFTNTCQIKSNIKNSVKLLILFATSV